MREKRALGAVFADVFRAIGRYFFDFFEEKAAVRGLVRVGSGDTHIIIYIRGRLPDRFSFAEIIDITST